jgi:hypothetical protein
MDHFARLRNSTAITLSKAARPRPDWVKNGDRWTITGIGSRGDLTVWHNRSQLIVGLPMDYVRTSTGLGYASTIHLAQGVPPTPCTVSSRGRSRGRSCTPCSAAAGTPTTSTSKSSATRPHTLIRPDTIAPRTPTETLQRSSPAMKRPSPASSLLRELNDPAARLFQAVQRYTD